MSVWYDFVLFQAPKTVQRTLENTREPEETIVLPDDDEVLQDERTDELAEIFDGKVSTKVLILSYTRPSMVILLRTITVT